jgi:Holliday junction resolvase RusA-like endonuclease
MTHLIIEIPPVPKGRPRFANGHAYTPKTTREYEYTIAQEYLLKGLKKHLGAISIFITFNYRIPTSRMKELKHGQICTEKADIDNLVKGILDSLNGIAYLDDKQVYKVVAEKKWADSHSIDIMIFEQEEE